MGLKTNILAGLGDHLKYPVLCMTVLAAAGCAGDLGNYTYTELDGPRVTNWPETGMEILTMEQLTLTPEVEGGMEADNYTYEWKVIDRNNENAVTVISETRDLDYRVTLAPGAYSLYFTMTEKESGIFWQNTAELLVSSSMSEGWMVLCSDDGRTCLDFVSKVTSLTYHDVLSDNEGMPQLNGPRKIQWLSSMTDAASPYYLLTDDGATRLGKDSFEWKEEYSMLYESGEGAALIPHSIVCSGFGKMLVSGTGAHYCETMGFSGLYGSAVNKDFEAAPTVGANVLATQVYAAVYLLYDITEGRFMGYCPLLERPDLGSQEPLADLQTMGEIAEGMASADEESVVGTAFDEYPEGYGFVYMENTRYDPGNASMGVTYTILADGRNRYVYGIQCGDMLRYADCPYVIGKACHADISACTDITGEGNLFAFSSLGNFLYYTSGSSVYRVDMSEETPHAVLQFDLGGETITCLKFNLYQNSENSMKSYDLIVGSMKAGGEGVLRIYEGYASSGNFIGAVPAEQYGGFDRIVDVTYKERVY